MDPGLEDLVRRALEEDRAAEDLTTQATVPAGRRGRAQLVAKESCVIAGLEPFRMTFAVLGYSMGAGDFVEGWRPHSDGAHVERDAVVEELTCDLRVLLSAERTALNFVRHLSGIATLTARFVEAAGGSVEIRDTRKTTPGLRALEKAAVRAGGGTNHRPDLESAILIKDNHIAVVGDISKAVALAKATGKHVEVECETIEQVESALAAGADELLLDNMDPDTLRAAAERAKGRARTEASGNVSLENVAAIAATGVDAISVGALTHSAPSADLSLDVEAL